MPFEWGLDSIGRVWKITNGVFHSSTYTATSMILLHVVQSMSSSLIAKKDLAEIWWRKANLPILRIARTWGHILSSIGLPLDSSYYRAWHGMDEEKLDRDYESPLYFWIKQWVTVQLWEFLNQIIHERNIRNALYSRNMNSNGIIATNTTPSVVE